MKNDVLEILKKYELCDEEINFENILLLGVDNGDGEYIVAEAECSNNGICIPREKNITVRKTSDYALAYINKEDDGNEQIEIGEILSRKKAKSIFANYKKLPNIGMTKINRTPNAPTFNYIMQRAVGKLIEQYIIQNRSDLISNGKFKKSKILIFIGRPSSDAWEKQNKDYMEIISDGINLMKRRLSEKEDFKDIENVDFYVIPVSEARAAMVHEYKTGKNIKNSKNRYVAVIDGGSSTFDMVVMYQGEVICEYSRQVGAGMLDRNLLHLILLGDEALTMSAKKRDDYTNYIEDHNDEIRNIVKINSKGGELAKIRSAKEKYFGDDGVFVDENISVTLSNKKEGVIHEIMDKAFNKMSVVVDGVYQKSEEDGFHCSEDFEYLSFSRALEDFFKGAKAKFERTNPGKKIDDIIVTGGATIMPQVDEIMYSVFGIEKNEINVVDNKDAERKYSVAKGCAYLGYIELYKQIILRELLEEIVCELNKSKLKEYIVEKQTDALYLSFLQDVKTWTDSDTHWRWTDITYAPWDAQAAFEEGIKAYLDSGFLTKVKEKIKTVAYRIIGENEFDYKPQISNVIDVAGYLFTTNFRKYIKKDVLGGFFQRGISDTEILSRSDKEAVYDNFSGLYRTKIKETIKNDVIESMDQFIAKTISMFTENIKNSLIEFIEAFDSYLISEEIKSEQRG